MSLKIFPTIILIICWLLLITNISYYSLLLTGVASLGFVFYNMKFYWKYFFFIVIFLFIVLIFLLVIKTVVFENNSSEQWLTVKVVQKYRNYYVVEYQKKYLMIKKYFFNISLNIVDQVKIKGIIFKHQAINNFHQYNWGWDYYGKHIVGEIKLTNKQYFHYEVFTLRNYIWKWLQQYDYNNLLDFFLLQNYSDNHSELLAMWQKLNVSHLLVVSGFHINLQITLLRWVLCKLIKKSILRNSIIFAWLSFYVYLLNWQLSALRALLYWTGSYINKIFKLNISSLDLWAVVCCFFLIMNPLVLYQTNWQFSFLISLIIIYVNQICWNFNKIMKLLFTQLTISIITLPITIYMQGHINLLFLVHQIIFSSLVQIFYYFFLVIIWIKPLLFFLHYLYQGILIFTYFLVSTTIFFHLTEMPVWFYFIYYVIVILLCYGWNNYVGKIMAFLGYVCVWGYWMLVPYLNSSLSVQMLNVGNALSILIKLPHNQGNILFDAGIDSLNKNNSLILDYLKREGINTLDAVFISHNHQDHNNNLQYLQQNLYIRNIYTNKLMQKTYNINGFKFDNWAFNYYEQIKEQDENNRSLVLFWEYQRHKFLLTGDLEKSGEKKLLNYILPQKINLFQVAHHGSNSSTSDEFLKIINPETCIISTKKTNNRNLPHPLVMQRLEQNCDNIYTTNNNQTIIYNVKNYQHFISTLIK